MMIVFIILQYYIFANKENINIHFVKQEKEINFLGTLQN
jgi:hypothetical protein